MSRVVWRLPCWLPQFTRSGTSVLSTYQWPAASKVGHLARPQSNCVVSNRTFSVSPRSHDDKDDKRAMREEIRALDEDDQEDRFRQHQVKRPWLRKDADKPPAEENPDKAEPMTKGKLLTTPTRLLKLILPLPIRVEKDKDNHSREYGRAISSNEDIQPLALLVHPQQPLSYVERLIQAELPPVLENGKEKIPSIYFRAEDTGNDRNHAKNVAKRRDKTNQPSASGDKSPANVASYSGLGREGPERDHDDKKWVRWSSSTEMGDFIRDAARGREFAVEIEGYDVEMRVAVPSFNDRTYYMRVNLRKMSREIDELAKLKRDCDILAHRGAHRLAQGGFALLSTWWGIVYYVTFHTEFGWDLVEPVTYLAGLTTIMAGYLWFLFISKDLSYKAAMNITVTKRQNALYEARGFDIHRWESLVQDANGLRKEIRVIASEYDVDWDDTKDVGEKVKAVLDKEKKKAGKDDDDRDDDDEKKESETEDKKTEDKKEDKHVEVGRKDG